MKYIKDNVITNSNAHKFILIFILIAMSRFLPHPPNFTNIISLSFFVPIILGIKFVPLVFFVFIITDLIIGLHEFTFFTWGSVLLISLISNRFGKNIKMRSCGICLSLLLFFVLSNLGVWLSGQYHYTFDGLILCYTMAIPFLKNMILSTIIYSAIIEIMICRYSIKKEILN